MLRFSESQSHAMKVRPRKRRICSCAVVAEMASMFEMIHLLAGSSLLLIAFSVLIFDIPRYTFSLVSLALFGARRRRAREVAGIASVSVIIPTFNGGSGLASSIFAAPTNLATARNHCRG